MKRVLWLNADRWACGWYRCIVPSFSLKDTGRYDPCSLEHKHAFDQHERPLVHNLEGIDLLVVQRARSPKFLQWVTAAHAKGIPVVYELDDDLFHVPKHNPAYTTWGSKEAMRVCRAMLESCDHVIVSTSPLKQTMVEMGGIAESKLTVAYNHLHPDIWGPEQFEDVPVCNNVGNIVIGYQGSITHSADFAVLIPALQRILHTFPQVRLRLFGTVPESLKGEIPVTRFDWMKGVVFEQYPRNLWHANFDINIAPLVDSQFNRCKSNLKVLDASAVRVPTVASTVHPYASTITHGVDGMLASTTEEWYEALAQLVLDASLRQTMAHAAFENAWAKWSWRTHGPTWVKLFDTLLGEKDHARERDGILPVSA
jgi:glycosyltransferase involved in cell wall biosynthesis